MSGEPSKTTRRPRADAVRNRERLLVAATEIFRNRGSDATLDAVARQAGVGIGTLYRHFPTRQALFEAVYSREVAELAELANRLAQTCEPVDALRRWLHANIRLIATKKGMLAALALSADGSSALYASSFDRLSTALGSLMERAIAAGAIRNEITADDLLWTLIGMCMMREQPGWETSVPRLVDVFVDGLCT